MPQPPKDAAWAERIADALINAVFQGDVIVDAKRVMPADLDHDDDKVGVLNGLSAVGRGGDFRGKLIVPNHPPDKRLHPMKLGFGRAHQGKFTVRQCWGGKDVVNQRLAKDDASSADHGNFSRHR